VKDSFSGNKSFLQHRCFSFIINYFFVIYDLAANKFELRYLKIHFGWQIAINDWLKIWRKKIKLPSWASSSALLLDQIFAVVN